MFFVHTKYSVFLGLIAFFYAFFQVSVPYAYKALTIDSEEGYSAGVLKKVLKTWEPPALRGDHGVLVKVALDGAGYVKGCVVVEPSLMDAFDSACCAAIKKAAPFGKTSYESPMTVFLMFHSGENSQKKQQELTEKEAYMQEVRAKNKAEQEIARQKADEAEKRAKEKALAAAKESGKPLPKVASAPVVVNLKQKSNTSVQKNDPSAQKQAKVDPSAQKQAKVDPSAQKQAKVDPSAQKQAKAEPAAQKQAKADPSVQKNAKPALPTYGETVESNPQTLPLKKNKTASTHEARVQKYTDLLQRYLNRVIVVPQNYPKGTYTMQMQVVVGSDGKIQRVGTVSSSGNERIDSVMKRCVLDSRTVPSPPKGIGSTFVVPITGSNGN